MERENNYYYNPADNRPKDRRLFWRLTVSPGWQLGNNLTRIILVLDINNLLFLARKCISQRNGKGVNEIMGE